MGIYILLIIGLLICFILYKRYFPVLGVPCKKNIQESTNTVVLDIRDYNINRSIEYSDMRIPYAYLKRFNQDIPKQELHVIANDRLELNLGLRYLLSKGHNVTSYQINNCPCRKKE